MTNDFNFSSLLLKHQDKDHKKTSAPNVEHQRHLIAVSYLQANTCAHGLEFNG